MGPITLPRATTARVALVVATLLPCGMSVSSHAGTDPEPPGASLGVGPLQFRFWKSGDSVKSEATVLPTEMLKAEFANPIGSGRATSKPPIRASTPTQFISQFNSDDSAIKALLGPDNHLVLRSKAPIDTSLMTIEATLPGGIGALEEQPPDFSLTLDTTTRSMLSKLSLTLSLATGGGEVLDSSDDTWTLHGDQSPFVIVTLAAAPPKDPKDQKRDSSRGLPASRCDVDAARLLDEVMLSGAVPSGVLAEASAEAFGACKASVVLVRLNGSAGLVEGMWVGSDGLHVRQDKLNDPGYKYIVNDRVTIRAGGTPITIAGRADPWQISRSTIPAGCRAYSRDSAAAASASVTPLERPASKQVVNGITVGAAKIFDAVTLSRMLNDTAARLAALSGFDSTSITASLTTLQGISRDTSYISGQLSTNPTPSLTTTNTAGAGTNASTSGSLSSPTSSTTTVTLQCPDGTLPAAGAACAVPTAPVPTSQSTSTTQVNTVPAATAQLTAGGNTSQQASTTTTVPSVAGVVPSALPSTALPPPTNVGLASADVLTEQVQLNSQITTLRMLLQGAASDQYLLRNGRAVGTRQQTTLGFTITLDPPRQLRHAVAEVRIVLVPPTGKEPVSIMNLLPSEKTYNVATITSHQDAFGAGVAIQPVNVGVSTGRSSDRLYLATDTDTLALEYPAPARNMTELGRPLPQLLHDIAKSAVDLVRIGSCAAYGADIGPHSIVFGWQFRPVLGEDYVKGGQRQVFAQLALPTNLGGDYTPSVVVETRWRAYDPKSQVVGAEYSSTCDSSPDATSVAFVSSPAVHDVAVSDLGGGQLKLAASGDFFESSLSILAGSSTLVPSTFDGHTLELFGSAHDLMEAGDLTILAPGGIRSSLSIPSSSSASNASDCGLTAASAIAVPRPDGNAVVHVALTLGHQYRLEQSLDGPIRPFILVGTQVYGTRESPLVDETCPATSPGNSVCYRFVAVTSDLRNAQTFLARDLSWGAVRMTGRIEFSPAFASLAALDADPSDKAKASADPTTGDATYLVSGFNLSRVRVDCDFIREPFKQGYPCLGVFLGGSAPAEALKKAFVPSTDNSAVLKIAKAEVAGVKTVRFKLYDDKDQDDGDWAEWSFPVPKSSTAQDAVASPGYLRVGDSTKVTFTGADFSTIDPTKVTFEGGPPLHAVLSPDQKSLTIDVTTLVTKLAGRKQLMAAGKTTKDKGLALVIDVVRQ